jgi:hypothetical protein
MKIRFFYLVPVLASGALMLGACADEGNGAGLGYGPGPGYGPGYGSGHVQGHMVNALQDLNAANDELGQASHDKGGHRVNAMQLINQAINEVNAGIAVGASHGD